MKTRQTLPTLVLSLGLGLGLSLTSCSDNDLDNNGGNNGGNNTELTDLEWQKEMSLERLLGALASVDSLPDNWNSTNFTVNEPTIGSPANDATPYSVRLVATPNVEEAYREYCGYVGKSDSGSATTDTWQMDGIGSITFTPNNQSDLYATLKVNVQQLPTLQEIRFVPASVIGNNSGNNAQAYYSFGDIIKQGDDNDATYWVCVRPVDKSLGLGQSHWCTFQLANDNFKSVQNTLTLPTGLGKNQAKSERMVQNLFNLMRLMRDPSLYTGTNTFDKIPDTKFTKLDVDILGYIWEDNQYWKLIAPKYYQENMDEEADEPTDFINRFMVKDDDDFTANVLYYGYTGKYNLFSPSSYKVYNLKLKLDDNNYGRLFSKTPETPTIEWNKNSDKNFKNIVYNPSDGVYSELMGKDYKNVFIVKDRTGAQLQGRWFNDADDNQYTESFETSAPGKGITDVLVYKDEKGNNSFNDRNFLPFFSLGDFETKAYNNDTKYGNNEVHVCIKPAHNASDITGSKTNWAYFISTNSQPQANNKGDKVELKDAQYIAFQLLRAFAYGKDNKTLDPIMTYNYQYEYPDAESNILKKIYEKFKDNEAISNYKYDAGHTAFDTRYTIDVNFYMSDAKTDGNNNLTNACVLSIIHSPQSKGSKYVYSLRTATDEEVNKKHFIPVYHYSDLNRYYETYGGAHTRNTSGTIRTYYKLHTQNFYDLLEFVEKSKANLNPNGD